MVVAADAFAPVAVGVMGLTIRGGEKRYYALPRAIRKGWAWPSPRIFCEQAAGTKTLVYK
jgi:hypothetical protein